MNQTILILFFTFFFLRLLSVAVSIRNEKRLKAAGALEYGKVNSIVLAILHLLFYGAAFAEGYQKQVQLDQTTIIGIVVYVLSIVALWIVVIQLSPIWTVKLIIAKDHQLKRNFLFRRIRHPNYFLNIIPELIGLVLMLKAWLVLMILFPVYLISLGTRILQEEKLMRATFEDY